MYKAFALMQCMRNVGSIYDTFCSQSYATVFRARNSTTNNSDGSEVLCYRHSFCGKILNRNTHSQEQSSQVSRKNIAFCLKSIFFVFQFHAL